MLTILYSSDSREDAEKEAEMLGKTVKCISGKYYVLSTPNEKEKKALRAQGFDPDSIMW